MMIMEKDKETNKEINQSEQSHPSQKSAVQTMVGFKNTEVGLIPEDWEVKKLGEVVEIKKGQLITEKTAIPNGIPVIGGGMTISYFHNKPNRTGVTITISASGAYAGYVSIHSKPIFASDCSTISEGEKYDIYFLYFCLLNKQREIYGLQTGGGQPHVYPQQLRDLFIAIPKYKAEQTAIATALNDADALIQKLEQLIAKKRHIKQGAMQQLLKPQKGWEVKKLGEVARLQGGYAFKSLYFRETGIPIIRISDINSDKVNTENSVCSDPFNIPKEFIAKKGDILIAMSGATTGKIGIYIQDKIAYINQRVGKLIINDLEVTSQEFIAHIVRSELFKEKLYKLLTQGAQPNISGKQVESIEFAIPQKKSEQTCIAQILSDMDSEIEALERQLAKYKLLKQGMMQVLLTGKIRLVKPVQHG